MRAYSAAGEEALRARNLLKDWAGEGFISEPQYQRMEQETACEFRRTNVFLRIVLFLFTLIVLGAGVALFFAVFVPGAREETTGVFLLIFAALTYAAAEAAVTQAGLYRYGIEEALAVCSVAFLCIGVRAILFSGHSYLAYPPKPGGADFLVPGAGLVASLWIWRRFGLPYAFAAAMIFAAWLPIYWASSHAAQHAIVAAIYTAGLIGLCAIRARYRFSYLDDGYGLAEAFLWLGIYLALNLRLTAVDIAGPWRGSLVPGGVAATTAGFAPAFYWATWVLIWCLPAATLARGLRGRHRFVTAAGAIAAVLTLITNKPYLGWARHTWDPMLLGGLLVGVAVFTRRWLAAGAEGIRYGYTAQRLSGKDKRWMAAGSAVLGVAASQSTAGTPHPHPPAAHFGGGDSAGGGASSDY